MHLLAAIERTFGKLQQPDREELRQALVSLEHLLPDALCYKTEPAELAYGRNVLLRTSELEVVVIHIPRCRETAIHDHGSSIGIACLVKGWLLNTHYRLDPESGFPLPFAEELVEPGQWIEAAPGQIHKLTNVGGESSVSLHVYAPPLTRTKRYAPYSEVLDFVI